MITLLSLLLVGIPLSCAALAIVRAAGAWRALSRMMARPTTPLSRLRDGDVEVEGTLRVVGEPVVTPTGARVAAVVVHALEVETLPRGKQRIQPTRTTVAQLAECELVDASGGRARLPAGTRLSVQGDAYVSDAIPLGELSPAWRQSLVARAETTDVLLEEHRIHDGDHVVVHAVAEAPRDASPYRSRGAVLVASPDEPMLLWRGSEAQARGRAWRFSVAMAACVAVLLDLAVQALMWLL